MSKSIKVNALFKTLLNILSILFPLITAPYIASVLDIDGFTEFNKAQNIFTWCSPFAVFGIYTYGLRTISQIKNDPCEVSRYFTRLFVFNVGTSSLITIVFLLIIFTVPGFSAYTNIYVVYSFQLLFICFSTDWANEAFESYGYILVKTFLCKLIYVISIFIFVKQPDDVFIYVLLTSLHVMVNNFLTFIYAKYHIPFTHITLKEEKKLVKPLFIVFLLVNSSLLFTILDRFVLTWFDTKLNTTYYNQSQQLINAILQVTSSIVMVSIPRLSNYWATDRKEEFKALLEKTSTAFMAIHTPCCLGLAVMSTEVIFLYTAGNYMGEIPTFILFSIRYYIAGYDTILSKQVLLSTGNESHLTKIYYTAGAYNIICKIILILTGHVSPELCVVTTASADILVIILELIQIKKLGFSYSPFNKDVCKYLLTSLCFLPIALAADFLVPFDGLKSVLFRTAIIIPSSMILYAIMMIISKDRLYEMIKRKIKN